MRSLILADTARADIVNVLSWSEKYFGATAKDRYEALIAAALKGMVDNPKFPGSHNRPELGTDIRSWHLKISRLHVPNDVKVVGSPRHLFFYRIEPEAVQVVRLLHESMDLPKQLRF